VYSLNIFIHIFMFTLKKKWEEMKS
jgi:hypothetical protein